MREGDTEGRENLVMYPGISLQKGVGARVHIPGRQLRRQSL